MEIMILVFVTMVYKMMPHKFFHQLKRSDYGSNPRPFKLTKQWLRNEGRQMWLWLRHMVQDVNESWSLLRGLHGINGTCQYDDDDPRSSAVYDLLDPRALGKNTYSITHVSWSKGIVECLVSTNSGDKTCTMKLGKALQRQIESFETEAAYQAWFIYENKDNSEFFGAVIRSQYEYALHTLQRRQSNVIETKRMLKEFEVRSVDLKWRISADPADLFTMSHGRPWHSCQGIEGGYRAGVFADVAAGSAIMFFYRPGQSEPCGRRLVRLAIKDDQLVLKLYHGYGTTGLPTKEELQKKTGMTWLMEDDEGWSLWITAPELLEYQGGYSAYLDGGHWHQTLALRNKTRQATEGLCNKINDLRFKQRVLGEELEGLIRKTAHQQQIPLYEAMDQCRKNPLQLQLEQLCQEERDLWQQVHEVEESIKAEYLSPLVLQIRLLAFQHSLTNSKIEFPIDQMAKNLIGNENFWKLRERDKFTIKYLTEHNSRAVWNSCEPF